MKIRTGFVSNSSSSCFICDTKLKPEEVRTRCRLIWDTWLVVRNADYEYIKSFGDAFGEIRYANKDDIKFLNDWLKPRDGDNYSYDRPKNVTKKNILIYSTSDNTIAEELFDLIENAFGATRIHLG